MQRPETTRHYDLCDHEVLDIALISDTHGEIDPAIVAIVADCDVVLHAGDLMGVGVLDKLKPRLGRIIAVRGNNDFSATWPVQDHARLADIADTAIIKTCSGIIAMEHGHLIDRIEQDQSALAYKHPDARVVVYGHTHVRKLDDSVQPWLINPGAAGRERNQGGASCYRLRVTNNAWSVQDYKFPSLKRAG